MRLRCRSACLISACALFAASASGASAQTSARPARRDSVERQKRDSVQRLQGMTVQGRAETRGRYGVARSNAATRTPTLLRDVPQAVSAVSQTLVADQAMQSMADIARAVPGMTMALGEGHRDAPTIRGNSSTADFFVDGVRDDAQYLRDLYNTDRIEVLKGANALSFGRGGGGGVINRVTRSAGWTPSRGLVLEGGSFAHSRGTLDVGGAVNGTAAARLNGMYERSNTFRDGVRLERVGVNPTVALRAGARTMLHAGYEYFDDARTIDRGIPSFRGRPSAAPITTVYGTDATNRSTVVSNAATALLEHDNAHGFIVRNRTRLADYDKFYGNVFPGAVDSTGTRVSLQAYDHSIDRRNLFNQTDVTFAATTGAVRHLLLVGGEVGHQRTEQVRRTGYFNNTSTSVSVSLVSPSFAAPVVFRPGASDADSWATASVSSVFAQDQLSITEHLQIVGGVRYDSFRMRYRNNRTGEMLARRDAVVSPRVGLVVKPVQPLSVYGSYAVSFLPSSGDQFTALTVSTQALAPERFTNREIGIKWEPLQSLSVNTAVYRLDRTNTTAPDPIDATRVVQSGAQRTSGVELGISGDVTSAWQIVAGVTTQRARIVSRTSAARAGATVPLVPRTTLSLWNRYDVRPGTGMGLGVVHQATMYAAIDNTVRLPGFTRLDGAMYLPLARGLRAQANVENLLNTRYYGTSHGNNNIMPGATRTLRISMRAGI